MDAQKKLSSKGMSSDERDNLWGETTPPSLDAALSATRLGIPEHTILNAQDIPGPDFRRRNF